MTFNRLIYRIVRPMGGLRLAQKFAANHPRIFMYHRINSGDADNGGIPLETFREQMVTIRRHFNPVSLSQLIDAADRGEVIKNAVAVTFDDGYHDFAEHAFPVLEDVGIPATLFVTTGFLDGDIWLWPDQIAYLVKRTKVKRVELDGLGSVDFSEDRTAAWHRIADHCLTLPNKEKLKFIASTARKVDVEIPSKAPAQYAPLRWDDVRDMAARGLNVGSHSHSHPVMSKLDNDELAEELRKPKERIEKQLGIRPTAFCYPNGQPIDFNSRVKEAVRDSGYCYALAAFPEKAPLADRWAIKRYPASTSRELFEKALYGFTYLAMRSSQS